MNLTPEGTKIPILMYHSVADDPTKETRRLSVLVDRFERQIEALRDGGYTGVTFSELGARGFGGPHDGVKPVVITFDDGYADFYNNAFPVLHEYGFPATLFVTTGWIADAGAYAAGRRLAPTLSWSQIVELSQSGVEIGAHGHSHAQLDQLNLQDLAVELTLPRQLLEARLQHSVKAIAYPYGYSSKTVRAGVRAAGYDRGAAVRNRMFDPEAGRFRIPRLTVKRATGLNRFRSLVAGERLGRTYAAQRMLTVGWLGVRRVRSHVNGSHRSLVARCEETEDL